jgi:hypothetical protein
MNWARIWERERYIREGTQRRNECGWGRERTKDRYIYIDTEGLGNVMVGEIDIKRLAVHNAGHV